MNVQVTVEVKVSTRCTLWILPDGSLSLSVSSPWRCHDLIKERKNILTSTFGKVGRCCLDEGVPGGGV